MASLHISSDTGPLHIANAVHTPLIALFGPTLPDRSGPYGNKNSTVLLADNPGTKECRMDTIPVEGYLEKPWRCWERELRARGFTAGWWGCGRNHRSGAFSFYLLAASC